MSTFHELTIVIPTYNRPKHLNRSLYYWSGSGFRIIIADGSTTQFTGELPANVTYLYEPFIAWLDRWKKAVSAVLTPYILLCADDDFYGLNALRKCIQFLEENPEYTSVSGRYLGFKTNPAIEIQCMYSHAWDVVSSSDKAAERMKEAMNPFMVHIYSVHRTDEFLKSFLSFQPYGNSNLIELHINMVSSIFGKHRILPFFYSIRESIPGSEGSKNDSVIVWIDNINNVKQLLNWKNCVSAIYQKQMNSSLQEAENAFEGAIESYRSFLKHLSPHSLETMIRPYFPNVLIKIIRSVINFYSPKSPDSYSVNQIFTKKTAIGRRRRKIYDWDNPQTQEDWEVIEKAILWGVRQEI